MSGLEGTPSKPLYLLVEEKGQVVPSSGRPIAATRSPNWFPSFADLGFLFVGA